MCALLDVVHWAAQVWCVCIARCGALGVGVCVCALLHICAAVCVCAVRA